MILQLDVDDRGVTTLLHLLRKHADDQDKLHGGAADRMGGDPLGLRPGEMVELADAIEVQRKPLEDDWL